MHQHQQGNTGAPAADETISLGPGVTESLRGGGGAVVNERAFRAISAGLVDLGIDEAVRIWGPGRGSVAIRDYTATGPGRVGIRKISG